MGLGHRFSKLKSRTGLAVMFGPVMRFPIPSTSGEPLGSLVLRPLTRSELPELIRDGNGFQSHDVTKTLARFRSYTIEDLGDWYDRTRGDDGFTWGVAVEHRGGSEETLIGVTSLSPIDLSAFPVADTGLVLTDTRWWGKGIAGAVHKCRTVFAFEQAGSSL